MSTWQYACAAAVAVVFFGIYCVVVRRDAFRTALGVLVMGQGVALLLVLSGQRRAVGVLPGAERAASVALLIALAFAVLLCALWLGVRRRRGIDVSDSRRLKG